MRYLHSMIRVKNLKESIAFYCDHLGMKELRRKDYPSGEFTLVFIGYGPESENTVLELTYNWDKSDYDHGDAFGHFAIAVDDINQVVEKMKAAGVKVTREPGPMKFGGSEVIAFIEDPNGYSIELIEKK